VSTTLFVGLALVAAAPATKDPPKKDAPTLVGVWVMESATIGGQPDKQSGGNTIELAADGKAVFKENGNDINGSYKADAKKDPPEIDLTMDAGGMNLSMPGIFKLDGDTLTICMVPFGERPKAFASAAGTTTMLLVLKRTKKD
jgi:uncharacterized protein (TIGR03067 family)